MSAFVSEAAYQKATMQHSRIEHQRAVALDELVEKIRGAIKDRGAGNYQDTASSIVAVILEDVFARTEEGL